MSPLLRLPGLRPDPATAHDWLRAELAHPAYQPTLGQRLQQGLDRLINGIGNTSNGLRGLGWPFLVLVFAVLLVLAALVLARLQRSPTGTRGAAEVFDERRRPAVDHRRLAEAAYAGGEWEGAVVEGIRWLAADLAERRVTPDDPGITTREVATLAAPRFPAHAADLDDAVRSFEEVRYGGRSADRARADRVLAVVRAVTAAPVSAATSGPVLAVPR